jgi:hypothetical protein
VGLSKKYKFGNSSIGIWGLFLGGKRNAQINLFSVQIWNIVLLYALAIKKKLNLKIQF